MEVLPRFGGQRNDSRNSFNIPYGRSPMIPPPQVKKEDDLVEKARKWCFIVLVVLVLGTAAIFILKEIFRRFLNG